jgi:hypothetical protein
MGRIEPDRLTGLAVDGTGGDPAVTRKSGHTAHLLEPAVITPGEAARGDALTVRARWQPAHKAEFHIQHSLTPIGSMWTRSSKVVALAIHDIRCP